jgi:hypothetical protein
MPVNVTDTLHVTTTEGVLATADEIYDKSQRKFQSQINSEKLNVVVISYGYDESIDGDTFIDDMSVVLDSLERATSTDATLLMQRVSEFGDKTTYYGVVRKTGAGYEICWLLYEYPMYDNSNPALEARFYRVFVEYDAQVKPQITTGSFLTVIDSYEENPDVVDMYGTPVGYQVFYDQTINKQLKPAVEGSAGQVLTKTGPNAEDVSWQTPSGGGGTSVTVVQETGDSETDVMSQAALTRIFKSAADFVENNVSYVNILQGVTPVSGYLDNSGNIVESATYDTYEKIPVQPSSLYSVGATGAEISQNINRARFVCLYDADGSFIKKIDNTGIIITTADTAFVSVSFSTSYSFRCLSILGANLPTSSAYFGAKIAYPANAIRLPNTLYILNGVNNNIFYDTFARFWDDGYYVSQTGATGIARSLSRVLTLKNPTTNTNVTFSLNNAKTGGVESTIRSKLVVGTPSVGDTQVTISIIGDSYTHGDFFVGALLANGYVPNLKMVGLRRVNDTYPTQHDEGRGGWKLADYFKPAHELDMVTHGFNPFWQPNGEFRFWGTVEFWAAAKKCADGTYTEASGWWYQASMYNDYVSVFDDSGYLVSPTTNDIMYSQTSKKYMVWSGTEWVGAQYETYTWAFDYAKYLAMWSIEAPEMLFMYLGVNDFWGTSPTAETIGNWLSMAETLKDSYFSTKPDGKFAILTPTTVCMKNQNGYNSQAVHANMWALRTAILDKFDYYGESKVFVIDTALAIDSEHSFVVSDDETITLPFDGYTGDDRINASNDIHPRVSYLSLGYPLAAFIQAKRSL